MCKHTLNNIIEQILNGLTPCFSSFESDDVQGQKRNEVKPVRAGPLRHCREPLQVLKLRKYHYKGVAHRMEIDHLIQYKRKLNAKVDGWMD